MRTSHNFLSKISFYDSHLLGTSYYLNHNFMFSCQLCIQTFIFLCFHFFEYYIWKVDDRWVHAGGCNLFSHCLCSDWWMVCPDRKKKMSSITLQQTICKIVACFIKIIFLIFLYRGCHQSPRTMDYSISPLNMTVSWKSALYSQKSRTPSQCQYIATCLVKMALRIAWPL